MEIKEINKFKAFLESNKSDEEKTAMLLLTLLILDKRGMYPTAKELLKTFLESKILESSKKDIANFILDYNYIFFVTL